VDLGEENREGETEKTRKGKGTEREGRKKREREKGEVEWKLGEGSLHH